MSAKLFSSTLLAWLWTGCFLWALSDSSACAAEMKLEVQLLWGTTNATSPDPKHKEVEPAVKDKLDKLPLKWNKYFLVNSQPISLKKGEAKKVRLSEKCAVQVKNLEDPSIEVSLYGRDEDLMTRVQALPKGEVLILGGNAPNKTSWLVVLKRTE
jgi:hypothetical protein